jgi:hypothetical protein
MKIVAISFVWNEIKFIKYKHEWAKDQGIDLYIIDNMSDDGTWEYLQENNIPSHRLDTNGTFDLIRLQSEVIKVLHQIKPDWYIYHGADLFFFTPDGIKNDIIKTDKEGYDSISLKHLEIRNSGENFELGMNLFDTYFFGTIEPDLTMIGKYSNNIEIIADNINHIKTKNIKSGLLVNYGMTKSKEEREETLRRRQKAWESGLNKNYGIHYPMGQKINWTWDRNILTDIRNTEYSYYLNTIKKYFVHK